MDYSDLKRDYILKTLEGVGLGHHFEVMQKEVRAAICLELTTLKQDNLPVGQSKIGGRPDLPKDWEFPLEPLSDTMTRPYSFLGQINLSELTDFDTDGYLPKRGLLSFFFSEDLWGDLERLTFFKVFYLEGDLSTLERKEFPESSDKDFIYPVCAIEFGQTYDFPNDCPDFIQDEEFDAFIKINNVDMMKLLGFANNIQNPPESGYFPLDGAIILPENPDNRVWRTLMQFPTNDESGMYWIDNGTIFFGIREDTLEQNDFTKCCYNLQMY